MIQVAPFHLDFVFDGVDPDDITNATNRAPYATLHLLREDSVARAGLGRPGRGDRRAHLDTLRRLGPQGWQRLLGADE